MRKLMGVVALVAIGVGCDEVDSQDIDTSGIYADISVTGNAGGSALASAVLRVGDATSTAFVELNSGDTLTASDGTETRDMEDAEILEFHSYNTLFDDSAAGTTYTIAFTRDGKDPAPSSTAVLPEPFEFTSPPTESLGTNDLVVTWEPSGKADVMSISFGGDCVDGETQQISGDPGTFTLPANTLKQSASDTDDPGCDVTVTLSRTKAGSLDSAFGGGSAHASQVRTFVTHFRFDDAE